MMDSGFSSTTFSSVRFVLVGFNPIDGNTLRSKLVSGGGVDVGQYSQNCTHLIVDKLVVYDDPICVTARSSGKVVVTGYWVHHSFDTGILLDANSVLYRPLIDANGIPGSKSLVMCLTGYIRQDREDVMTMVDLMGAQFSKPLVANRITHLICYKFEGEKYELAKRMKRIKLVNHRWLEDCLKNWKLLPEANYEISGYELEIMEASARDSEDEAQDASVKRANNSPLGLRVGVVAAVGTSKPEDKDIPDVQTNSGVQEGSSFCNTSKDNWLTPKKTDKPFEAMVSTSAVVPEQQSYQRASTFQDTSNYDSHIKVANKTPEKATSRMEPNESTSVKKSIRRHSSLATYSRKTLQRSPEPNTLRTESIGHNGSLRMDDNGLNISASKSVSSMERTTLFEDLDKTDKLHGEESPPMLPQAKFTDGSVSSKGLTNVHHNSESSITPPASLLLPEVNLRPVPSINDGGEVGHKSPVSVFNTKVLSSNVVPMEDAASTAEHIISKCARDEIPERSSTEAIVGNILLQEPRAGSPKQNLRVVPNTSDHIEGREVAGNLDLSDSAIRLFNPSVVPMDAAIWTPENITLKGELDEVPERSVTEPEIRRSSTSPGSGLIGMKDKLETELTKKKTATRKSLGTRGRRKNPVNQKGSIYLSEPIPKDEHTDCLIKGKVSAPATDIVNEKEEVSSPVLNTEVVPEMAKHIDSETEAVEGTDSVDKKSYAPEEKDHFELDLMVNQDKLQANTSEEADAEVGIRMLEPKLNDVPTKDSSDDGSLQIDSDKSKSKRKRKATVAIQSGKKESSSTTDELGTDTLMKDIGDISADEKESLVLENKSGKVSFSGDTSPVAEETLARKEAAAIDPSNAAVELVVNKNKGKRRKDAAVEENRLRKPSVKKAKNSKKEDNAKENSIVMKDTRINSAEVKVDVAVDKEGSSVRVEASKPSFVKKTKKSKKGLCDTVMKDIEDNSAKEEENDAVDNKCGKVGSGGDQSTVSEKPLARKKVAKSAKTDKVDSGGDKSSVSVKPLARKKVAKSAKTGTKVVEESKQLIVKALASKKVLQDQEQEPKFFTVSGPRPQRNEYQKIIRSLKGNCCRDSHQWSYQATHFIASEIRRTEKFFAAAASGSWILKTDYVADSKEAGKLLPEEAYEWHSTGLSADGAISLEAPRKWRLVREQTGHGALYGLRIVVYGDCTIPSLDTLKRAVKAGDGTILATAPPYTRFLNQHTDLALICTGMPRDDLWIQEFVRHEIPCVLSDYLVEYVCKPGYPLDKHVLYNTNSWAERSFNKMQRSVNV